VTSPIPRVAKRNLALALVLGIAGFGLAVVTASMIDFVLEFPAGVVSHLDFSGLAGPLFAAELQNDAKAAGRSPRNPALIDRALNESSASSGAQLPDGTPALHASRAQWVHNGWRVQFTLAHGFECVTVPRTAEQTPEIRNEPCRHNLGK